MERQIGFLPGIGIILGATVAMLAAARSPLGCLIVTIGGIWLFVKGICLGLKKPEPKSETVATTVKQPEIHVISVSVPVESRPVKVIEQS